MTKSLRWIDPRTILGVTLILCLFVERALAQDSHCAPRPMEIIQWTDQQLQKLFRAKDQKAGGSQEWPDHISFHLDMQAEKNRSGDSEGPDSLNLFDAKDSSEFVNYEALLRPRKTATFQMLNLFVFKLERTRHLMYVCMSMDSASKEPPQLTIYFLAAFGLSMDSGKRDNWATWPGDWLFGPDGWARGKGTSVVELTSIPIEFYPLHQLTNGVHDWTAEIPFIEGVFKVPGTALKFSNTTLERLHSLLGAGVERIKITEKYIEFANQVNPANPEEAHILYVLPLDGAAEL